MSEKEGYYIVNVVGAYKYRRGLSKQFFLCYYSGGYLLIIRRWRNIKKLMGKELFNFLMTDPLRHEVTCSWLSGSVEDFIYKSICQYYMWEDEWGYCIRKIK